MLHSLAPAFAFPLLLLANVAYAQVTDGAGPALDVEVSKVNSIAEAKQRAEVTLNAAVTSSQILVSAQQVKAASIFARADNSSARTLEDLVDMHYLRSIPLPYPSATRVDGDFLMLAPVNGALCEAVERRAGRLGTVQRTVPSADLFGCYLEAGTPVIFYHL